MEKVQKMVLAAQKGDREAFGWLYRETYDRNYYIVIKMVKHEQDAMDVLQDAYVKVFQKLATFRYNGSKSFASWTSKVASNTALDFLRKKNPILFSEMQGEDDGDIPALDFEDESAENQPELALDRKETARIVQELLDCLSEEQRICVILRYVREMKVSEIAAECGCPENTVKSRLSYAKKRLLGERETLEKKGIRLYSVAPFTLLAFLLGEEASACEAPAALSSGFSAVMDRISGGEDGSFAPPEGAVEQAAGELVKPTVEGTGKAVAQKIGKAAEGQAGRTAARWGTGKMLAAAAAALVAVGAVSGALFARQAQKPQEEADHLPVTAEASPDAEEASAAEEPAEEPETAEEITPEPEPEAEPRTEEEIYYEFISQELVPRYGLAELSMEGTVTSEGFYGGYFSVDFPENHWLNPVGLISAHISDLNQDGTKELFVLYWEQEKDEYDDHRMMGDVYETDGEQVMQKDSVDLGCWGEVEFSDLDFFVGEMGSMGKKYLVFYRNGTTAAFVDGFPDHAMWTMEYKDGRLEKVREVMTDSEYSEWYYDGILYENGEEKKRERLYEDEAYVRSGEREPGPYATIKEAFIGYFREDGLDVSELVGDTQIDRQVKEALHESVDLSEIIEEPQTHSFTKAKDAKVIFVYKSRGTDGLYEETDDNEDGWRGSVDMTAEIFDATDLREHITVE